MRDSPDEIPTFDELAADPEVAALLDFVPVPRQRQVEAGWTPERQREFIARLATHGSPGRACDEMGKTQTGMMKVYRNPLGASFRGSWHAAIDLARRRRAEAGPAGPPPMIKPPSIDHRVKHGRYVQPRGVYEGEGDWGDEGCPHCGDEYSADRRRLRERNAQLARIRRKLFMARRVYLLSIADDPERRAAWELLCGAADWAAAAVMGEQPDENPTSTKLTPLKEATLQVPLKTGFLPDLTEPDFDPDGDPLAEFEKSAARHDPRWNGSAEPEEGEPGERE